MLAAGMTSCVLVALTTVAAAGGKDGPGSPPKTGGLARASTRQEGASTANLATIAPPVPMTSSLDPNFRPIDLNSALRLAGVENPELNLSRQRVVEAVALRQLAAAQILPTINLGTNYDNHTGNLQQSNGNILSLNRSAVFVGAGANAVAAGTVNIPGLLLTGNVAEGVYGFLVARQVVAERGFASDAVRNQVFLSVTLAYCDLLQAEGRRAVALQVRDEAAKVYRLVAAYSKVGKALQSDADRFATELARRQADVQRADGEIQVASARLCELLNLDPSVRLHPTDAWVVPSEIFPPQVPVAELIAVALLRRPELAERRAVIREALLSLRGSKVLPFSPTIIAGFSAGGFGGGSNLVSPVFGGFGTRSDLDVVAYWSIRNMGVGNVALINLAKARLKTTQYQEIAVLDQVRAEVAEAYAKAHARFALIGTTEQAVRSATDGFRKDLTRAEGAVGLPIEVVDSLRLLAESRFAYLEAIVGYNRAQFELYVATGQPPADALARAVPTAGVVPPGSGVPGPAQPAGARPLSSPTGLNPPASPPPPAGPNGPVVNPGLGRAGR